MAINRASRNYRTSESKPNRERDWISDNGTFLFGKHEDEAIEDVAVEDPSYIRSIIYLADDMTNEDRRILEQLMNRR